MLTRRKLLAVTMALPYLGGRGFAATLDPSGGDQTAALQQAISEAGKVGGVVQLGAGTFETRKLSIDKNVTIQGIPGATKLFAREGGQIFSTTSAKQVILQGLGLSAKGAIGNLLAAENVERLIVEDCDFAGAEAGMRLRTCGGRISGNRFRFHQQVACQSFAGTGIDISGNTVSDIGNVGIQVYRDQKGDSPTIISNNFVSRIAAEDGGDGPNGNGINVYASHGAIVSNNHVQDCAFSAIRNASSDACIITGNLISRCNEVALYVEFEFLGAVVSNNIIDTASHGISITNFMQGGRLAQCSGNVVRNIRGTDAHGRTLGGGIAAEADTVIANNAVENCELYGIGMGWGKYARNLSATGNIIKDCPHGIRFSVLGPGPIVVANNVVSGATRGAILGMDHDKTVTGDLTSANAKIPEQASVTGNMVKN